MERWLYRLSRSTYADRFVLKGALLLLVWLGETIRPTRDADFLAWGDLDADALRRIFAEICEVSVEPDGLEFDPASVRVAAIRREDRYGGQRVHVESRLGNARLRVQADVGIGDAVTPEPEWLDYPTLLDMPGPRLRAYRPETAIAEKVHAMIVLGSRNSRMRDFFDIHALAQNRSFDGDTLSRSLLATFARRDTPFPTDMPIALTPAFADEEGKRSQWAAFMRRSRLTTTPDGLESAIHTIADFVGPVLEAAARGQPFTKTWQPGGPWR
jgi:predicted nucleotidyltransferase component of viral defense system